MPDVFVARQPIFNRRMTVVGYELLFRGGNVTQALIASPEGATATVVLNSFTEIGLEQMVGDATAWINVSREFVLSGLAKAVPSGLVGLEILENQLIDDEMIAALRELRSQGYQLALDDFRFPTDAERLLGVVDVVKLDLRQLGREQLAEHVERLKPHNVMLLAEKLETRADYAFAADLGCDLFQGYFFCEPVLLRHRGVAANRMSLLRVVAALHDPKVELAELEHLIARDVALSFRLLRYINSAFFGLRGEVRSVGQALALLGIENLRQWATLTVLASIEDKPPELSITALIRARFCERAGAQLGIARPGELFTLGLFSVIDALMDAPMEDVLATLPFPVDIREALIHRRGEKGLLLDCVTTLETGEFDQATTIVSRAGELYLEALMWANRAAGSLFGDLGVAAA
jgi:EAL and modified HD-GYP domain-containing signal transduction protein